MKGWSQNTETTATTTRPEPEPDMYQECVGGADWMGEGERLDIEIRGKKGTAEPSITVRRIGQGAGVSHGEKIDLHDVTEKGICDAIKRELQKCP